MSVAQGASTPAAALGGAVGTLVMPLLRGIGNNRSDAVVASAVPDPDQPLTFGMLAVTLERLGYDVCQGTRARERWHQAIDGAAVVMDATGEIAAFVQRAGRVSRVESSPDGAAISDPIAADPLEVTRRIDHARRVIHLREMFAVPLHERNEDVYRVLAAAFGVSLFINLFGLAIPFLTVVVFDHVIGGAAPEALPGLAVGGLLAVAAIFVLRRVRAILLASAYGRFGHGLQGRVAYRLWRAPLAVNGRFQVYAVLARVREAWLGVDLLTNSLGTALLDAPFMLLTLVALAFVGGWLVLVPTVYLILFFTVAILLEGRSRLHLQIAGAAAAEREAMLSELAEKSLDLRLSGLEGVWLRHFAEVSRRATATAMHNATRAAVTQSVAYVMGSGVALATLAFGIGSVFAGRMTAGDLMATMLLIWRIVGPAQALFYSIGRLRQWLARRDRLQALMQAPVENDRRERLRNAPVKIPQLRFDRVSYRHPGAPEQTLTGVSFVVEPGEIVAVLGPTGSGKTSVLQIAAGLLAPQLGVVLVDGENLTHIDIDDYRLTVAAYVPARPHFFRESLKDNVALAAPWIDDTRATKVVREVWGVAGGDYFAANLARTRAELTVEHLSAADAVRLGFARMLARPPRLAILDTPLKGTKADAIDAFEHFLTACRGSTSVMFSTDDPAMARFADKVLILNGGLVAYFGPPKLASVPLQAAS
jgi:ATP-binding cassette subfamily C protein/ATP-binding cassette subfamily C protein LapB